MKTTWILRLVLSALLCLALLVGFSAALAEEDVHFLLSHKDNGVCKRLTGDVELAVILVETQVGTWQELPLRQAMMSEIETAMAWLEEEAAAYGVRLDLTARYFTSMSDIVVGLHDDILIWAEETLAWAENPLDKDAPPPDFFVWEDGANQPVIFCVAGEGRAFAIANANPDVAEFLIVYQTDIAQTLCHELMHLYGAWDYYYHPDVVNAAQEICPDSLMLSVGAEGRVDSLAAYVIGWTDVLEAEATALLTASAHLTEADIWAAQEENIQSGFGTQTTDAFVYTGNFLNGKYHGWGTIWWVDGSVYTGQWVDGERTGTGIMRWADGSTYIGEFTHNAYNGQGTLCFANGDIYSGEWVSGMHNGEGVYTWADGGYYSGGFRDGTWHGYGVFYGKDGNCMKGFWEHNVFVGE